MSEAIKINGEVLQEQINKLDTLINNVRDEDVIKNLSEKIQVSSGSTISSINDVNRSLVELNNSLFQLLSVTKDLLSNTHSSFIEADNNIARKISGE